MSENAEVIDLNEYRKRKAPKRALVAPVVRIEEVRTQQEFVKGQSNIANAIRAIVALSQAEENGDPDDIRESEAFLNDCFDLLSDAEISIARAAAFPLLSSKPTPPKAS